MNSILFSAKVQAHNTYWTSEFDNLLNRVIKCTLKFVWNIATPSNQKIIRNLLNKLGEVSNQNCTPRDCDTIQLSKIEHISCEPSDSLKELFPEGYGVVDDDSFEEAETEQA